ncbi:unnamed protein product, partial [Musa acuminata var. zebrina]
MVNLTELRGMPHASLAPRPCQPTMRTSGDLDQLGNSESGHPRKKPKTCTSKMFEYTIAQEVATQVGGIPRGRPH